MIKLLALLLIIVLLVGGVYFLVFNKRAVSNLPTPIQKIAQVTPTPTFAPAAVTDQAIDQDMTALDQDLNNLDKDNAGLASDLNNL